MSRPYVIGSISNQIREALKSGPKSISELCSILGVSNRKKVHDILHSTLASEVIFDRPEKRWYFVALPKPTEREKTKSGSGVIAGRRTVPAYVFPTKFKSTW